MSRKLTVVPCKICEILLTSSPVILVQTVGCSRLIQQTERVCAEVVEAHAVIWRFLNSLGAVYERLVVNIDQALGICLRQFRLLDV